MSNKIENHCVDCDLPCIGKLCLYKNVSIDYCDNCNYERAEYHIDDEDLCEDCAKERIREIFNDLTLAEQAEAVDVDLNRII